MRLTWIGVKDGDRAALLERLGLEVVDGAEAGHWESGEYMCRTFPGGWFVVASHDGLDLDADLAVAAGDDFALGVYASTVVMGAEAIAYQSGKRVWSVLHDPDHGLSHLAVEGDPPAQLAQLRAQAEAEQAQAGNEVDYAFDIPNDLAAGLVGFNPQEDESDDWTRLRPTPARRAQVKRAKAGIWLRLALPLVALFALLFALSIIF